MIATLKTAHEIIGKTRAARGFCGACYDSTKRCEPCAGTPSFPWADRLDAERVCDWLEKRFAHEGEITAFALNDLEELT